MCAGRSSCLWRLLRWFKKKNDFYEQILTGTGPRLYVDVPNNSRTLLFFLTKHGFMNAIICEITAAFPQLDDLWRSVCIQGGEDRWIRTPSQTNAQNFRSVKVIYE